MSVGREIEQGRGKHALLRTVSGEAMLYLAGALLSVALLVPILNLHRADLHVPLAIEGDGEYYAMQIKTLLETGWVYENPRLGAPFGLELYDFPHFDALFLGIMKVLGLFSSDWAVVFNAYYLLTFPLTTISALLLLRALRIHPLIALACALLYAFQPYHFARGQGHIMLASYFLVPLMLRSALWLSEARGLSPAPQRASLRSSRLWPAVVWAGVSGFAGHYYACFACMFYLVAAMRPALLLRRFVNLRQAVLLCVVTVAAMTINLLPNILYWREHGQNRCVSMKSPSGAKEYGLRPLSVFLPVPGHRASPLADLTNRYLSSVERVNEAHFSAVGAVSAAGLLVLIAGWLRPRRWFDRRATSPLPILGGFALVTFATATSGGLGTLLAKWVTPQIQGWNRISIFLAMFGLVVIAWLAQQVLGRMANDRHRRFAAVLIAMALVFVGVADQTTAHDWAKHDAKRATHLAQARFVQAIEEVMPPGSAVYQWPPSQFPACDNVLGYGQLQHYLHSNNLRWSEPQMTNRPGEWWRQRCLNLSAKDLVEEVARAGMTGLVIDSRVDRDRSRKMLEDAARLVGSAPLHDGGHQYFFDLRRFVASHLSDGGRPPLAPNQVCPVTLQTGPSFWPLCSLRDTATATVWRLFHAREGALELENHTFGTLDVMVRFTLRTRSEIRRPATLQISGAISRQMTIAVDEPIAVAERIVLPPGRSSVRLEWLDAVRTNRLPWLSIDDVHAEVVAADADAPVTAALSPTTK